MNKRKILMIIGILTLIIFCNCYNNEIKVMGASAVNNNPDYTFENEDTIILHNTSIDTDNKDLLTKFEKVKHIKIDTTETYLGLYELTCFTNAISIYIPANITSISSISTYPLPNLKEFLVDEKNSAYSSINGVLYNKSKDRLILYPYNGNKDAVVEAGTKIIEDSAFNNVPINSVIIPEGVILIESEAFAKTNLTEISLPTSFRSFYSGIFKNTPLTKVIISEKNKSLTSIDGVVYSKDKSYLYYWPEEKIVESLILPQELTYLDCSMIKHFNKVKQITIPDALTAIIGTADNRIEQIFVNKQHPYFKQYDGVLYSSDYKNLRLYPNQNKDTDITIHNNLEVFPMELFCTENTTKVLTLPKNLRKFKGKLKPYYRVLLGGFVNLSELKIDRDNKLFVIENGVLYNKEKTQVLWYPIDLPAKEFKIPETVTNVDNDQLVKQNHLEKLVVSDNCKLYDFVNDYDYGIYTIPTGTDCPNLKEFVVSKENPYYISVEGVLLSKDKSVLLVYPSAKTDKVYQIPDTVEVVAFGNENHYLQTLKIPQSVHWFGDVSYTDGENHNYGDALLYFSALKEIEVDPTNQFHTSIDGVLYSNGTAVLIAYPVGKTNSNYYLPKEVDDIYDVRNLNYNPYLKDIYIDSSSQCQYLKDGDLWIKKWYHNNFQPIHFDNITLHTY
ncbi:MAG TPA: hypothetical protein DHW61_00160 [Lachnoclostridium phytofermentans]|uniref:Uncharacterized protein n=1 Tax=Lachnoclostridium phytofermentans TaxID=66219 RepID=A0A3D2X2G9_9FIRM|nr:leucine-rich repeat domain-containing protein [Lachnoclostridium sp.]HCL00833.1 hypothetical protein [Lachnoclostridium phytofermentans]